MKFNRKIALYATAFLLGAAVTAACSNKKEQPASQSSQSQAQSESGSQAAQSSANAASSAANQAEKAVSLNYDIVNHVGDDKEAIINALGKPANKNKTDRNAGESKHYAATSRKSTPVCLAMYSIWRVWRLSEDLRAAVSAVKSSSIAVCWSRILYTFEMSSFVAMVSRRFDLLYLTFPHYVKQVVSSVFAFW